MYLGTPQLIYLAIVILSTGLVLGQWGKSMKIGWTNITSASIGLGLLYWGGFFTACP